MTNKKNNKKLKETNLISMINQNDTEKNENDICSICLNKIQKHAYCSSCFHCFCFNCIKKWSNVSNQCPVCRKSFKNILHNINSNVKIIKLDHNEDKKKFSQACDPFYIIESPKMQSMGVLPIGKKTGEIIQIKSLTNEQPEIDITNMTHCEDGKTIITRHKYHITSLDENEQQLFVQLINSAVNRSIEDHNDTITFIDDTSNSETLQKFLIRNDESTARLIDVYTPSKIPKKKARLNFIQTRYNLRSRHRRNAN